MGNPTSCKQFGMGFALPHSCERKKVNDTSYKFLSFCSLCSHGEEVCVHRLKSKFPDAHGYQSNDIGLILFFSYLFSCFLLIKQEVKSILRLQLEISKGPNVWGLATLTPSCPWPPSNNIPSTRMHIVTKDGELGHWVTEGFKEPEWKDKRVLLFY